MSDHHNPTELSKRTLELLWSRVQQRGDLPAFSKAVTSIVSAMQGDEDQEFNITKTVLSDPSLTQSVLRLANSPMYEVFGKSINTVSKAVVILGTDVVGQLALGLKLIDGLSAALSNSTAARGEMEKSLLASHIARQVASSAGMRDAEEAVVCSMMHTLGRMMLTFYIAEQWAQMQALCDDGMEQAQAVQQIFGLALDEVGSEVASRWGLPKTLVASLKDVEPGNVSEPLTHIQWLATISTMSSRCAEVMHQTGGTEMSAVSRIACDYADMLGIEQTHMRLAIVNAKLDAEENAIFVRSKPTPHVEEEKVQTKHDNLPSTLQILTSGVTDMHNAGIAVSPTQLTTMALETIYKALNLSRAIVFTRNFAEELYAARLHFGDVSKRLISQLVFGDAYQPDVFHAALVNDKMICIEDTHDAVLLKKLPRWWKDSLSSAHGFVLLPLSINRQPQGFIYGDWLKDAPIVKMGQPEINALNELRTLVERSLELRLRTDAS
jgi:HD-like signal output (HDOD) protein